MMRGYLLFALLASASGALFPWTSGSPAKGASNDVESKASECGSNLGFMQNSVLIGRERNLGTACPRTIMNAKEKSSNGDGFGQSRPSRSQMNSQRMNTPLKSGPTEDYLDMLNHALSDQKASEEEEVRRRRAEAAAARAQAYEEARMSAKAQRQAVQEAKLRAAEEARLKALAEQEAIQAAVEAERIAEQEARQRAGCR